MVLAAFSFAESTMWEYIWVVLTLVCPSIDLICIDVRAKFQLERCIRMSGNVHNLSKSNGK